MIQRFLELETVSFSTLSDPALVQVEAGNRALKAVFGSKLAAKGKSLAELLQPHSTGKISHLTAILEAIGLVSLSAAICKELNAVCCIAR